jgi:hypothetical protein
MIKPDLNQFVKEVTRVDQLYKAIGLFSHYINSDCILVQDKIISKGKHYLFASTESEFTAPIVRKVMLLDVFYHRDKIHLFLLDKNSHRVFIASEIISDKEKECPWLLADENSYEKLKEIIDGKLFCKNDCSQPNPSSDLN